MSGTGDLHWVFVHGAGGSSAFWELVRPAFPDSWAVDLPGHAAGRVRRPGDPAAPAPEAPLTTISALADWLIAAIAARGRPDVVVVGHSMGGAVAQSVALQRPPWLRGLVLSATAARLPVDPVFRHLQVTDYPAAVDWYIDHAFARPPDRYRREGVRRQMLRVPAPVAQADYAACAAFDIRAAVRAGAIGGPAVVVAGELDQLVPAEESAALVAGIIPAAFARLAGAGHMAPVEQPDAWSATVWRLWAGLRETHPGPAAQ